MVGHLLSEEYLGSPLRIEYEGAFYHVTARGNERERIFFGKGDYDKFKGAKGSGTHLLMYMEG
jgi:hypothetical protein